MISLKYFVMVIRELCFVSWSSQSEVGSSIRPSKANDRTPKWNKELQTALRSGTVGAQDTFVSSVPIDWKKKG
ncbi:hypothetical protein B7P43_G09621 [Cryptotermes secundus]|uniref:Uncharacterized protein n=1 Tax=Cryptotermes secundus TaxID=105785 RepID=A0A2J7R7L0_9NEOP|nr:hypothetical protein B7P43_G09621 [Cryptotermes secundus]